MSDLAALLATAEHYLYPNYVKPDVVLDRGVGARLWDKAGRSYIDLYAGVAVSALGHGHPALVRAISEQAAKLLHVANYFHTEANIRLAEKLCQMTHMDRAFFCNSGTEANEALLKLARRHFYNQGQPERFKVLAFENSFHGRTLGALAATGQPKYQEGFGPLPGVVHVPYGDIERVRAVYDSSFAAILVEPILGEGGVLPAPDGFLQQLRELTTQTGTLLIADEVQSGIGRTGRFLAFEHANVQADAVALAKGLGGGFPVGAMVCKAFLKDALPPGAHGTTYGGNPLASAAALAVLETVEREELVPRAERLGRLLSERLTAIAARHPKLVKSERGLGFLRALVLQDGVTSAALIERFRNAGVLLIAAGPTTVRFCPPLTISESDLDEALTIVDRVLGESA